MQVCRGLFQAHRLIFSFLICTAIQKHTSGVNNAELAVLLRGLQPIPTSRPNPAPTALTPQQWGSLAALEEAVPALGGLLRSLTLETQQWLKWIQASSLGITAVPSFGQVGALPAASLLCTALTVPALSPGQLNLATHTGVCIGSAY